MSLRFPKSARLTGSGEFRRVREHGRSWRGELVFLNVLKLGKGETRVGIITSKRVGSAVARNRARRKLREIFRHHRHELETGCWLVIVARSEAARAPYATLEDEVLRLAKRASILTRLS